jgi:hypothetical protein
MRGEDSFNDFTFFRKIPNIFKPILLGRGKTIDEGAGDPALYTENKFSARRIEK